MGSNIDNESILSLIKLAVGVILTAALISLAVVEYNRGANAVKANNEKMMDVSIEWSETDFNNLFNRQMIGSEVVTAIKKYKSQCMVYIGSKTYSSTDLVPSDICMESAIGTDYYVDPFAYYTCSVESSNANGVVTAIRFTPENGFLDADGTLAILLKEKLGNSKAAYGILESDSLDTILTKIYQARPSTLKQVLGNLSDSVGNYNSMTYEELCSAIQERIDALEDENLELSQSHEYQYEKVDSVASGASARFSFTPNYVIITAPLHQGFAQVWIRQSNNTYRLNGSGAGSGDEYGAIDASQTELRVRYNSENGSYEVSNPTNTTVTIEAFSSENLF